MCMDLSIQTKVYHGIYTQIKRNVDKKIKNLWLKI